MSRKFFLPYRKGSKSIGYLARLLDLKGIRLEGSRYTPQEGDKILNWGNSNPPVPLDYERTTVLNWPEKIAFVTNKLNFFRHVSDYTVGDKPRIPDWTQNKDEVRSWIQDGSTVLVRNKLTGHSGEGIDVLSDVDSVDKYSNNTLYVRYVKKKDEYRLHFLRGEIFDVQKKSKVRDRDEVNYLIRNHANGFIYSRNNFDEVPADVILQSQRAINTLDIDFGAVDVIYNKLHEKAYVLEINTAPGLEGTTLNKYHEKFQEIMG